MTPFVALLAFAAAAQAAPQLAPRTGPPPPTPSIRRIPDDPALAWTFTARNGGCSARVPLPGGAALDLGFHPGRDENYFSLSDPAWPPFRDGASVNASLRFAPGEEEPAVATTARSPRSGGRVLLFLRPARGEERLRRIGRFGIFVLFLGDRNIGAYGLPQAEAGVARLIACAREAGAGAPSGQRQGPALNTYFTTDDYPREALRRREQGTVTFSILVGPDGRVADCTVTGSSGSASLDAATCRILRERARYRPARDPQGNAVAGREDGLAVTWSLPPR